MDWKNKYYYIKMYILSKAIYRFSAIPIKITLIFIIELGETPLKCIWKHRTTEIFKALFSKENKARCIMLPDFKICYKVITINMHSTGIQRNS